jgi:catechol 2,3-dioxygenase-like lactoylglutathione lyase family enzyme
MIDHVSVGVRDIERSVRFYEAVLGTLGYIKHDVRPATVGFGKRYSEFWINLRPSMSALPDIGHHVCLRARDANAVDAFHAAAIVAGGFSDGAPGLRPQHGDGYYAAFVRDPDGNRVEAVTFLIEQTAASKAS